MFVITPHGSIDVKHFPKQPTLKEMQEGVGGPIETLPYFKSITIDGVTHTRGVAYCNEEGWLRKLEDNPRAHYFWQKACPKGDPAKMHVSGTIIFIVKEPVHDDARQQV